MSPLPSKPYDYDELRGAIQGGSKSFRLASLFLPMRARVPGYVFYRACRMSDDWIDEAPSQKEGISRLSVLRTGQSLPAICDYRALELTHRIPSRYFDDLLSGYELDLIPDQSYATLSDLHVYCYRVAGAVGLVMAHILVRDRPISDEALVCADSLGRAMQMTNIARDVREDQSKGRVYLPLDLLGSRLFDLTHVQDQARVFKAVEGLLQEAERLYKRGRSGLRYLPFRAAVAISVALTLYRAIGRKLLRRGPAGLLARTVVGPFEKTWLVACGIIGGLYYGVWKRFQIRRRPALLQELP